MKGFQGISHGCLGLSVCLPLTDLLSRYQYRICTHVAMALDRNPFVLSTSPGFDCIFVTTIVAIPAMGPFQISEILSQLTRHSGTFINGSYRISWWLVNNNGLCALRVINSHHGAGSSINSAICKDISKFCSNLHNGGLWENVWKNQ